MSSEEDKFKHSKRFLRDEAAIKKHSRMVKVFNLNGSVPKHSYAKTKPYTCGKSTCHMCGNPRKFFGEKTLQEIKFEQDLE